MSAGPLTIELILVFVLTAFLLHKYGNWRRQHFIVTIATFVGWYFSFIIVFILPLDVALTFYHKCKVVEEKRFNKNTSLDNDSTSTEVTDVDVHGECFKPGSYVDDHVLLDLWRVVYWTSQALTWLILPMMQSYSTAGDFTAVRKLRTALYENALYYGSLLLVLGVLLIYAAAKGISLHAANLKVICITASNTWGLFLLVLLLGFGLVEVPRQVWQMGTKGYRLQKTYFDIEKLSTDKNDAEEAVREAFRDVQEVRSTMRDSHPFREQFPVWLAEDLSRSMARSRRGDNNALLRDSEAANVAATSEKTLVRLHKRVIDSVLSYDRTHAQWDALISQALHLEEVAKNENNPIGCHRFERTYRDDRSQIIQQICIPSIEWYWECLFKRPLLRFLGGFLGVLSVFVIWSECTFFSVHPTLSLAAVFVYSAADKYSYGYIELSSVLIISFLSICAYYTVFKLRIYRYYHLDPHHHTDENSLLFSAILLCRLTPPLGLNFLGMIHLDSHITSDANFGAETSFTKLMGHMDVIPFISNGFNIYFPIGIVLLCLGTWFRLGTRCLHGLGIDQFIGEDEMTTEMVQGGKALVNVERNKQRRELNRETRQEYWNDKLGSQDRGRSLRTMGQKGSATRGAHSDDDDRTAIVPKMEQDPEMGFDNGNDPLFEQDWHRKGKLGGYGSPGEPPKGIFDDL